MKPSLSTQKNVGAFFNLIMAFTIGFNTNTTDARPQQRVKSDLMNQKENIDSIKKVLLAPLKWIFQDWFSFQP